MIDKISKIVYNNILLYYVILYAFAVYFQFFAEKGLKMGKGFKKFKRKLLTGAVIRALLFGVSLGSVTGAVLFLTDKLTMVAPELPRYLIWGGSVALASAVIMFLILLPTSKRVAKKLDKSLKLGEKAQTMLAFRHDESDMAILQREDTERILQATPKRKVKGTCTFVFAILPVLATLLTVGSILVPAIEPPEPPPVVENNFSMTPWQEQALKDLIQKVKTSDMEESPKEGVVKQLESLLIKLKNVKKESAMKETVISTIESIHSIVSGHNTYDVVADSLYKSPNKSIQDLAAAVASLKPLLVGEWINSTCEAVTADPSSAALLAKAIRQALTTCDVDASNEVIVALGDLATTLESITAETAREDIEAIFATAEESLNAALFIQSTNESVEDDTIYSLLSIFGIKASEVPEHVFNNPEDPRAEGDYEEQDDPDKIHSGGLGTGEMVFGSNETIYDPETEQYVTYGTVIESYYAKITELIVDVGLPPEMEEMVSDYFAILFKKGDN